MKILTKSALAKRIDLQSLFTPGGTVDFAKLQTKAIRYDRGKYKRSILDRDMPPDHIIWYQSRTDPAPLFKEDKNYVILWTIDTSILTTAERSQYDRALAIWKSPKFAAA